MLHFRAKRKGSNRIGKWRTCKVLTFFCIPDNGCQTAANSESTVSNGCNAVGDGYGGQAGAIIESTLSYVCHATANGDGCKSAAFIESILSNARDLISNDIFRDLFSKYVF